MKKISILVVASFVMLLGFAIRSSPGQHEATSQMRGEIRQGETLTATLAVDKAPSVDVTLDATAHPASDQNASQIDASCRLNAGQTSCEASGSVPLDAPIGEWTVSRIQFTPTSGGRAVELSKHGGLSFRIEPHGEVSLPSSATVSNIK